MGRQLRSHLSFLHPDTAIQKRFSQKQHSQKKHHDLRTKLSHFNIGDTVFVFLDFPSGKSWLPGTLTKACGPLAFMVNWIMVVLFIDMLTTFVTVLYLFHFLMMDHTLMTGQMTLLQLSHAMLHDCDVLHIFAELQLTSQPLTSDCF